MNFLKFYKNKLFLYTLTYIALRFFSYYFPPETPLHPGHPLNSIVGAILWLVVLHLLDKKNPLGWLIILGEIILGGSGGYLAINGVSLRLLFLIGAMVIFIWQKIKQQDYQLLKNKTDLTVIIILGATMSLLALWGIKSGNNPRLVIADFIPFLFLFYYFPLRELLASDWFKKTVGQMLAVAIIGNLGLMLLTFFGFSYGVFVLQGEYYHWFRDVALGKITEMTPDFFRVVLNEQLLLVPLFLYFFAKKLQENNRLFVWLGATILIILAMNLTRIYLLALPFGLLFLITKTEIKKWLLYSVVSGLIFLASFTLLHLTATRGQSWGWEFFGLRLQSITAPRLEDSSLSRMLILPRAWEKINARPLEGHGLGDELTVYSPVLKKEITTPQYDWGWLEIWAETGLIGLLTWLAFILRIFIKNKKNILLAGVVALLVINITSPALFHLFGVLWLVMTLAFDSIDNDKKLYV